jgi:hypothetical protein
LLLLLPSLISAGGAEQSPANVGESSSYGLRSAVFGTAGGRGESDSYALGGTMGQPYPTGLFSGTAYDLYAGFWTTGDVITDAGEVPLVFRLMQNYPNPFNPVTTIRYSTASPGRVELTIYDVSGRRVRALVSGMQPAGVHTAVWDGRNDGGRQVAAGVYFYRLAAGRSSSVRKMVILR